MLIAFINRDGTPRNRWQATLYEAHRDETGLKRNKLEQTPIATQLVGIAKAQGWAREERVVLIAPAGKHTERSRGLLWGIECIGPRGCGLLGRNTTHRDAEIRAIEHESVHAIKPIRSKSKIGRSRNEW
jgi:hypothetical protein